MKVETQSDNFIIKDGFAISKYDYDSVFVEKEGSKFVAKPRRTTLTFRTKLGPSKVGLMIVGIGGNNGTTLVGGILAHIRNLKWETKNGLKSPNWLGSVALSSTLRLGLDVKSGKDFYAPVSSVVPISMPTEWMIGGWDISKMSMGRAMGRSQVFHANFQQELFPYMEAIGILPGIFDPSFVAPNQRERADHVIKGTKKQQLEQIRRDIVDFKRKQGVDILVVVWSGNTERMCEEIAGIHDTGLNLLNAVEANHMEISPSVLYCLAAILEGCHYVNGSPQNTFLPGIIELASGKVFLAGDDFKTGQTKLKSVLADFLVGAGLKPVSIVSYNHLGNNDGFNLSSDQQFRTKELSKSSVLNDLVEGNPSLYPEGKGPDHAVVIKYVPYVGDSKRAMDEYISEIFMHGTNSIAIYNTCEDSLLAVPIILDLVIFLEYFSRVTVAEEGTSPTTMHCLLSALSYMLKSPKVPSGSVVNSLFRQKECLLNILRATMGLPPENNMTMEHKLHLRK